MRIGIISDIHGNLIALDNVLAALKRVDRIVCLGDVAYGGPDPSQAIARLCELACPIIMGNTDEFFVHASVLDPNDGNYRRIMQSIEWARAQLIADDLAFVNTFKPRVEISLEGGSTLLCYHALPSSNTGVILATTPDNELAQKLGDYRTTVMAGGHTHVQMLRRFGDAILLNPGSVGMPIERGVSGASDIRPPWSEYAIVTSERASLGIELRRTPLDMNAVIARARKSGMPHAEEWISAWRC